MWTTRRRPVAAAPGSPTLPGIHPRPGPPTGSPDSRPRTLPVDTPPAGARAAGEEASTPGTGTPGARTRGAGTPGTGTPGGRDRALGDELRAVHDRLRRALQLARESLDGPGEDDSGDDGPGARDPGRADSGGADPGTAHRAGPTPRDGAATDPRRTDLLLFCHGFCAALTGHHRGEDGALFPEVRRARPDLTGVLDQLEHDHHLMDLLVTDLEAAMAAGADPQRLQSHLDGLAAITESHFAFEERSLLPALDALRDPGTAPATLFGPLA